MRVIVFIQETGPNPFQVIRSLDHKMGRLSSTEKTSSRSRNSLKRSKFRVRVKAVGERSSRRRRASALH